MFCVLCRHRVWQWVRWLLPHTLPQWLLESGTGLHAHQWHHKVSHHLSSPRYLKLFFSRLIRELTFTLAYHPLTLFKFNLYASMSRDNPWTQLMGGADTSDEDQDTIKVYMMWPRWSHDCHMTTLLFWLQTTLLETNPYLLALTVVVSIVHSVFEFLAFKNGKYMSGNDYIIMTSSSLFIYRKLPPLQ